MQQSEDEVKSDLKYYLISFILCKRLTCVQYPELYLVPGALQRVITEHRARRVVVAPKQIKT